MSFLGGQGLDWQSIIGVASIIIALCALVFTIKQGSQARKHNSLSVRPFLTIWTRQYSEKGLYEVELINNGLGPALIEKFTVKVDGKVITGEGTEPVEKALKVVFPNHNYQSHQSYVDKGYSMAPKEKCTIVAIQFTDQPWPTPESVSQAFNRAELEVAYKSFYEEPFLLSTAGRII